MVQRITSIYIRHLHPTMCSPVSNNLSVRAPKPQLQEMDGAMILPVQALASTDSFDLHQNEVKNVAPFGILKISVKHCLNVFPLVTCWNPQLINGVQWNRALFRNIPEWDSVILRTVWYLDILDRINMDNSDMAWDKNCEVSQIARLARLARRNPLSLSTSVAKAQWHWWHGATCNSNGYKAYHCVSLIRFIIYIHM